MTVLDTNVISELMAPAPSPEVGSRASMSLFVTAVTQAEILYGIRLLPRSKLPPTSSSKKSFSACGIALVDPWSADI